ncbi:hypothetical protein D3C72_2515030 [compost metagenome]
MGAFAAALAEVPEADRAQWTLHVEDQALLASLQAHGVRTTNEPPLYYAFIGF